MFRLTILACALVASTASAQTGTIGSRVFDVNLEPAHTLDEQNPNAVSVGNTIVLSGSPGDEKRVVLSYPDLIEFRKLGSNLDLNQVIQVQLRLQRSAPSTGMTSTNNVEVHATSDLSASGFTGSDPTWNCASDSNTTNTQADCFLQWQGSTSNWLPTLDQNTFVNNATGSIALLEATNSFKAGFGASGGNAFAFVVSKSTDIDGYAEFYNSDVASGSPPSALVTLRMCCWDPACIHGFQGSSCNCDIPIENSIAVCDTSTPDGPTLYPNFFEFSLVKVNTTLTHKVMFNGLIGDVPKALRVQGTIKVRVNNYNTGDYGFLAVTAVIFQFKTFEVEVSAAHTVAQKFVLGASNSTGVGSTPSGTVSYRGIPCNLNVSVAVEDTPMVFNGLIFARQFVLNFDPQNCPSPAVSSTSSSSSSLSTGSETSTLSAGTTTAEPVVPAPSDSSSPDNIVLWIILGAVGALLLCLGAIGAALLIIKKKNAGA